MGSTFFGLEMMKKALFAQQTALNTVGHNVSNANTPGYSRQRVDMTASQPMYYPSMTSGGLVGQIGTGVDIQSITRLRESFLDNQFRNQNQMLGEWEVKSDVVKKLEAIFNEPSDTGLTATLNQFFNAWQTLSTDPNNSTTRAVVMQRSNQLIDLLHQTSKELGDLNKDITTDISTKINEFNSYIDQIKNLNGQIQTAEVMGANANDLRDKRDLLVDQLSKIADITATETKNANGTSTFTITMGQGNQPVLVDTGQATWNHLSYNGGNFVLQDQNGTNPDANVTLQSGQLKGMRDSLNDYVGNYSSMLDSFAGQLISVVNTQHAAGQSLSGYSGNFFSGGNASDISLAITDGTQIAAATQIFTDPSGKRSGNGENALAISQLINNTNTYTYTVNGTSKTVQGTFEEFIRTMVGQLGVQGQEADQMQKNQQTLVDQMDNMRQSISGVSIDEEMANMIKFQQSYGAAARMVTTIDSLLNTIVTGLGITR